MEIWKGLNLFLHIMRIYKFCYRLCIEFVYKSRVVHNIFKFSICCHIILGKQPTFRIVKIICNF